MIIRALVPNDLPIELKILKHNQEWDSVYISSSCLRSEKLIPTEQNDLENEIYRAIQARRAKKANFSAVFSPRVRVGTRVENARVIDKNSLTTSLHFIDQCVILFTRLV